MNCLSVEELALQAETDAEYVRRLIDLGVVEPAIGSESYGPADVRRVQLLAPWEAAGFSVEAAVDLVRAGEFSVSWLDAPAMTRAERSDVTYEQLCRDEGVPLSLVRALQAALGFPRPSLRTAPGTATATWWTWSGRCWRLEPHRPRPWGWFGCTRTV